MDAEEGKLVEELVFDTDALMERVEGDQELLRELLALFFQEYPKLLEEISHAMEYRRAEQVERLSHSLKSALLNLSGKRAADAAYQVERSGRSADFQEIAAAFPRLQEELRILHDAMDQFLKTSSS
jgi:HPt (histidine-containing phosphotransfer) domain-containing protein